jgi:dihydroxyacetone kinase-like protein
MQKTLTYDDLARVLQSGANAVKQNHELLSKLDSATGDGDHGTTMKRTAEAILNSVQNCQDKAILPLLEAVGWDVMSVDGGSTSPLLGSFFMGMAEGCGTEPEIDVATIAAMFEAGLAKMEAQTSAKVGDKTMIDALVPAVAAMRQAANEELSVPDAFQKAADAAAKGAEGTKELQARFGRAKNLGPRSIGHVDPGATSISFLFAGFRAAL